MSSLPPNTSPTSPKTRSTAASSRTSSSVTSGLETESASSRTFFSIRSPWKVNATCAPPSVRRRAIAHAIERLLATPSTSARFPTNIGAMLSAVEYGRGLHVAVVTGASSGIGAELVRVLRRRGTLVVGLSRSPSEADEHEECDVSDRAAVEAVAARVLARHPRIDLLVNNAGLGARGSYLSAGPGPTRARLRVNS